MRWDADWSKWEAVRADGLNEDSSDRIMDYGSSCWQCIGSRPGWCRNEQSIPRSHCKQWVLKKDLQTDRSLTLSLCDSHLIEGMIHKGIGRFLEASQSHLLLGIQIFSLSRASCQQGVQRMVDLLYSKLAKEAKCSLFDSNNFWRWAILEKFCSIQDRAITSDANYIPNAHLQLDIVLLK